MNRQSPRSQSTVGGLQGSQTPSNTSHLFIPELRLAEPWRALLIYSCRKNSVTEDQANSLTATLGVTTAPVIYQGHPSNYARALPGCYQPRYQVSAVALASPAKINLLPFWVYCNYEITATAMNHFCLAVLSLLAAQAREF